MSNAKPAPAWTPGDCIQWTGAIDNEGYGRQQCGSRWRRAHQVAYEKAREPVPNGLQLDHLCRNRSCVNPDHLEPVTRKENILRGIGPTAINARRVFCVAGHKLSGDNLRIRPSGRRECKECARRRSRVHMRKTRAALARARGKS